MRSHPIVLLLFLAAFTLQAQQTFKKATGNFSFRKMVASYEDFRKQNDLNKVRGWKHFKRYEHDMQLHTNGHGEPGNFREYLQAMEKVSGARLSSQWGQWYPAGPNNVPKNETNYMENGIGRVNCIGFHPTNPQIFYVGVAQGGVWKTTDGGNTYTPLTDNLPITRVSDITVDPVNPNTVYISLCDFEYVGSGLYLDGRKRHTHYGLGVYKSTDAGASWAPTGLSFPLNGGDITLIRKVIVNPANTSELLAAGVNGMYKSSNAGATWTHVLDSLFWDMVQDPVTPSVVYAATGWVVAGNTGHAAVYKSTDFGATWTMLPTGIPMQGIVQGIRLAIANSDPDYVYAFTCDNTEGYYGMFASTNGGSSWTYHPPIKNILEWDDGNGFGGQGTYDMAVLVNRFDKNLVYTGGVNMWGSYDGGQNFGMISYWQTTFGPSIHGDIHAINYQPVSGDIFVCSDGGLYKTDTLFIGAYGNPLMTAWTNLSNGMQATSFYRISSSRDKYEVLAAGAQDNATSYRKANGQWQTIFGGDGMDNCVQPNGLSVVIGSSQYGNFFKSFDDGLNSNFIQTNPANEESEWVTPIVADYAQPGVLYIGNENVMKSSNNGQSWFSLGTIFSNTVSNENTEISALAVSPSHSNTVYAARRVRHEKNLKGIVFRTTDGGSAFKNITSNLPDSLYYTGIEVSPFSPDEAVICMAGFAAGQKVYRTTNGGTGWTNITYDLPNVPVNCIKYLPNSGDLILAADVGVYVLKSGSSNWVDYSAGLPNVIVSDIEINEVANKVYLSTFGRGVWAAQLSDISGTPVVIDGIGENNQQEIRLFPNPTNGAFTIERNREGAAQADVIDIHGRIVHTRKFTGKTVSVTVTLAAGAYYVRLREAGSERVAKLIIE